MDFYQRESQDGLRFSWNYWPCNKLTETRVVVPVGSIYTPLKEIEGLGLVEYQPVLCKQCQAVLNPHCQVDFRFKNWGCPICATRNNFPAHYASNISEQTLPAELVPEFSTIEYIMPENKQNPNSRPIFIMMVDTAIQSEELAELKDSL